MPTARTTCTAQHSEFYIVGEFPAVSLISGMEMRWERLLPSLCVTYSHACLQFISQGNHAVTACLPVYDLKEGSFTVPNIG